MYTVNYVSMNIVTYVIFTYVYTIEYDSAV